MKAIRIRHTLPAALLALTVASAQAGMLESPTDGRSANAPAGSGQRSWRLGEFTYIKLVPTESGAAGNDHPARVEPEQLRALLATARLPQNGRGAPLFGTEELSGLVEPLSEALSAAGPGDDVTLLSTSRRGEGFLSQPRAVTARIFVRDAQLNLLAKDTRRDFIDTFRGTHVEPKFEYGSRATASSAVLGSSISSAVRADWLRFPLNAVPAAAAPTVNPAVHAAPAAAAPAPPAKAQRDEAFYEAQEMRLRALKRLFDKALITDAEYQQKRRDIINGL